MARPSRTPAAIRPMPRNSCSRPPTAPRSSSVACSRRPRAAGVAWRWTSPDRRSARTGTAAGAAATSCLAAALGRLLLRRAPRGHARSTVPRGCRDPRHRFVNMGGSAAGVDRLHGRRRVRARRRACRRRRTARRRVLHGAAGAADDREQHDVGVGQLVGDPVEDRRRVERDGVGGERRSLGRRRLGRPGRARRRRTRTGSTRVAPSVATKRLTTCGVALISKYCCGPPSSASTAAIAGAIWSTSGRTGSSSSPPHRGDPARRSEPASRSRGPIGRRRSARRAIGHASRLHHDGHDHRAAAGAVVDELAGRPAHVALERLDVAHARRPGPPRRRRRSCRTPRRGGPRPPARRPSPRVMISGPTSTLPVWLSTVTTTTTTPSLASTRRSRSTPDPTSPTMPST